MSQSVKAVPEGYHTLTPMLTQDDTRASIAWYKKALGAEELNVATDPQGRMMQALDRIGDSFLMMHDVMKDDKGPKAFGGSPASFWIYTDDSDRLFNRAVAAGATVGMPMTDMFWGDRWGYVVDPFGY